MDRPNPLRRHSRNSKSASALPAHPELDPQHRRSGIRHFTHVPSLRVDSKQLRKASNSGKARTTFRSVSAMKWKEFLTKGNAKRHPPVTPAFYGTVEDLERAGMREEMAVRQMYNSVDNGVVGGYPQQREVYDANGQSIGYPYPKHLPPAAAAYQQRQQLIQQQTRPSYPAPPGYIPPPPTAQPDIPAASVNVSVPLERIISVSYGIGISIAGLFAYIFRNEVVKYGAIAGVLVVAWKFGQWHKTVDLRNREQEMVHQGRLTPAQGKGGQYVLQVPPAQVYQQIDFMPGR